MLGRHGRGWIGKRRGGSVIRGVTGFIIRRGRRLVRKEGLEDTALLPGLDEKLLLGRVLDGFDEAPPLGLLQVALDDRAKARD